MSCLSSHLSCGRISSRIISSLTVSIEYKYLMRGTDINWDDTRVLKVWDLRNNECVQTITVNIPDIFLMLICCMLKQ